MRMVEKFKELKRIDPKLGTRRFAKANNVNRDSLELWIKQDREGKFMKVSHDKSKKIREMRKIREKKAKFPDIDNNVLNQFANTRARRLPVSDEDKRTWAKECEEKLKAKGILEQNVEFKASNGWLDRFKTRNRIVSRAVTSVGQKVNNPNVIRLI